MANIQLEPYKCGKTESIPSKVKETVCPLTVPLQCCAWNIVTIGQEEEMKYTEEEWNHPFGRCRGSLHGRPLGKAAAKQPYSQWFRKVNMQLSPFPRRTAAIKMALP